MKAKIDEIWVIYRIHLVQNSRWNINLPLKINFGRWIKNWEQSGCWIVILPFKSHCMKEGKYHQKISDISPIYHRYFATIGDFFKKSPIYLSEPIYPDIFLLAYNSKDYVQKNVIFRIYLVKSLSCW